MLTVKEVSELLNCGEWVVKKLISENELTAVDLNPNGFNRVYRVKESDLDSYVQKQGGNHDEG